MDKFYHDFETDDRGFIKTKNLLGKVELPSAPREKQEEKYYSYVLHGTSIKNAVSCPEKVLQVKDVIEEEALFEVAVVRYIKCLTSSKNGRKQLTSSEVYDSIQDDPLGCHMKFKKIRNSYIVHDQNDFSTVRIGLVLQDGELKEVVCPLMQPAFYYEDSISILLVLCKITRSLVENILDEEIDRIHEKYKDEWDIEVIKSFPKMKEHQKTYLRNRTYLEKKSLWNNIFMNR